MGMMINRRRVCGGESLPYDAEIEYLESTGTQWIELPFCIDNTYEIFITFQYTDQTQMGVCGRNELNYGIWVAGYNNKSLAIHVGRNEILNNGELYPRFSKHTVSVNSQRIIYDGNTIKTYTSNSFINSLPYTLFTVGGDAKSSSGVRIFSFTLKRSGVTLADHIPVRVGNVGYMYDKVSGQLFGNAGTGSFILGPDKTN